MSQRSVVMGGYTFRINFASGRVVAMVPNGNRDEGELAVIASLFDGYSQEIKTRRGDGWRNGKWRHCSNPECHNAIHLRPYELEMGKACYCSPDCRDAVSRLKWKEQYASRRETTKTELPSAAIPLGENPSEQIYRIGDSVANINPRSDLRGKIGKVVEVETKEDGKTVAVKADFGEAGKVVRIYIAGRNLGSITLHQAPRKKRRRATPA